MLKLKGSMPVSFFTLEVDHEFKNTAEVEKFIEWAEVIYRMHSPKVRTKK